MTMNITPRQVGLLTLEEGSNEKRDPLDTLIVKMESVRPVCPVEFVEKAWNDITNKVVEITPAIKVLPPIPAGEELVLDRRNFEFAPGELGVITLDTVSKRTLFRTIAGVTGEIKSYKVVIAGSERSWGYSSAEVKQRFRVTADCVYHASSGKHTRVDLKIWKPDGSILESKDDDFWPYGTPGGTIHFIIRTKYTGEDFYIDQDGAWYGQLTYVYVS